MLSKLTQLAPTITITIKNTNDKWGFALPEPEIFKTDIPIETKNAIKQEKKFIIVQAPTGMGKTVSLAAVLARCNKKSFKRTQILMPFRVSVKEMHSYLQKLDPKYQYGYRMRGSNESTDGDNCTMYTVGYWLEWFFGTIKKGLHKLEPMVVVVDEAHDSTWQTDLALKTLIWAQNKGAPIQIIVSSATLDITDEMQKCNPVIMSAPNEANVDMILLEKDLYGPSDGVVSDELQSGIYGLLVQLSSSKKQGDILVLLPGEQEIETLKEALWKDEKFANCSVCPLYSSLLDEEKDLAIQPDKDGKRKIILATNIVENDIK